MAISVRTNRSRRRDPAVMSFLGVPLFEWAGLALALGLGVEAWLTIRKPSASDKSSDDAER